MIILYSFFLIILTTSFSDDNLNILTLTERDFPKVFGTHSHLIIMFYEPWAGLSKRFAPIFKEAVYESKYKHPLIQFAMLDATSENMIAKMNNITKFPTIRLYVNGYPIPYNGERSKEDIIKWIDKKSISALRTISSEQQLKRLSLKNDESVIIFGSHPSKDFKFRMLALADDKNLYFNASSLGNSSTVKVQIYRSFDNIVTYEEQSFDNLEKWIAQNSQPYIQTFNRDLLRKIFTDLSPAVVLFNTNGDKFLHRSLSNFAKNNSNLIFTQIDSSHQLFTKFSHYLNIDVYYPQIVIILAKTKNKIMYKGKIIINNLTQQSLSQFFHKYSINELPKIGITDYVGQQTYL